MVNFQIVDILSDDIPNDKNGKEFQVTIYGKTDDHKTIVCNVIGFKPYFYLKIPELWNSSSVSRFLKDIDGNIESLISKIKQYDPKNDLMEITIPKEYKELYGFKCNPDKSEVTYKFAKLEFSSHTAMSKYSEAIRNKYSLLRSQSDNKYNESFRQWMKLDKDVVCDSHLYESNIHPIIRFIHTCNIQPANWITIDKDEEEMYNDGFFTEADLVIDDLDFKEIKTFDNDSISPYVIASFDIECDSSHGDFPLPDKNFQKLAIDIYDSLHRCHEKHVCEYTLFKIYFSACIKAAFEDYDLTKHDVSLDINHIFTTDSKQPSSNSIEECMELFDDESFKEDFLNLKKRDLVIKRLTKEFNKFTDDTGKLLQVEGDKVIQIGTVFHRYGEAQPYKRHILVIAPQESTPLDKVCDSLKDIHIDVIPCKNEKDLLLGWTDIMKAEDPDFVTGYNIFGFDFGYMIDRMNVYCECNKKYCNKWCPLNKFLNMGKIDSTSWASCYHRNKRCSVIRKKTMTFGSTDYNRYIHMDGRVLYDLQKEVEKGHNLESYKLDNVASHFMRGKIKHIESLKICKHGTSKQSRTTLFTNEFGNLKVGDFISLRLHSNIGETYYKDGRKYKITDLEQNPSCIRICNAYMKFNEESTEDYKISSLWSPDTSKYYKVEWCLMKDDVSPQDIFEKHKSGGPSGRAEVAKYCIQDCELCINLTLALDIIPNNIAMANVCSVPQSYIYLRGQGAKIFSLISKVCDENKIRIPTLNKPFTGHEYIKMYHGWDGSVKEKNDKLKQYLIEERYEERYSELDSDGLKEKIKEDIQNINNYKQANTRKYELEDLLNTHLEKKERDEYKKELKECIKHTEIEPWIPYKEYSIDDEINIITTDNPPPRCGYEGAIVLDPVPGIYLEDPVGVVDYASLYPSSIIEKNISHDTLIEDPIYLNYLDKDDYETIIYDNYIYEEEEGKITISKKISEETPTITCHFLKRKAGQPLGIIPKVVDHLLKQRKATKKRLKEETNDFKKSVLDGLQLAYKLVANSVYGQMGARTSPIYKNTLAACTTAIGRERIYNAKDGVELEWWKSDSAIQLGVCSPPKVIYGDTDSVFIKWSRDKKDPNTGIVKTLVDKEALQFCIDCGKDAGLWVTENKLNMTFEQDDNIKNPQDLEYEKTFYPFILISKKRYVADKYEFDIHECKRNSMGIVLKRRDNAPIVKHVFGNVIEKIMIDKDLQTSVTWLKKTLADIRIGKFTMNYFIITKSLRGYYKNPGGIAHKVLADRMGERDPGNKPKPGDRMPFAYRVLGNDMLQDKDNKYKSGPRKGQFRDKKVLQGDRIEDPAYITKNKLELDYEFYITNQIMNPVKQVLDLEMDKNDTTQLFLK